MSFDEEGFLGNQIKEISLEIYKQHLPPFEFGIEVNKYTYKTKYILAIDSSNGQQVMAASLFSRIHNGYQTVILLSMLGLESEAKAILRVILESLFVLKAITDNEEEVVNFINTDKKKQEKLLKSIFEKDKSNMYEDLRKTLNKELLEVLRNEVKREGINDIEVYEWAQKAKMGVYYAYAYKTLNSEVHTDVRKLEKYLIIDNDDNIIGVNSLPSDKDIDRTLFTAHSVMIITLNCINDIFELNQGEVLKKIEERLMNIRE